MRNKEEFAKLNNAARQLFAAMREFESSVDSIGEIYFDGWILEIEDVLYDIECALKGDEDGDDIEDES